MSFMDKVFKKKDDYDDPFSSTSTSFSDHPDPLAPTSDPYAPASTHDPFSPNSAPGMPPPMFDVNNPDINSQTGTPRPREREYDPPSNTLTNTGIGGVNERDVQLILAKLDALKSELDSIHQRVKKIERIAEADQEAASKPQTPNYGRW